MSGTNKNSWWCPYYHQGLFIGSTPNTDTVISMCCWQKKRKVDLVRFDHEYLRGIRAQAELGFPKECSVNCSIPDHVANDRERAQSQPIWDDSGTKIKKLHLEQSLACNLTCITCSSRYSSAWNQDYKKFDPSASTIRLKKDPKSVWASLDLSSVESLHFTGGEPLMNPDNLEILEHLDKLGILNQVSVTYNTNGTIRAGKRLIELWSKMHWVRLDFSLDGIGSTFDYTRYPARWTEVRDNILWYQQIKGPCILIEVNAIVGVHNVFNMADFFRWWKNECQHGNQNDPSNIFVRSVEPQSYGGRVLNLKYLPVELKQPAQDMLNSISDVDGALGLIANLSTEPNLGWLDYLEKLDQLRGTNWRQSLNFPLNNYKSC